MLEIVSKNRQKITYFFIISLITIILLLLALSFKNDDKVLSKTKNFSLEKVEIESIKKFLISKIQSPFINIDYKIKKGVCDQFIALDLLKKNNYDKE